MTSAFAPVLVLACIPALLQGRIWGMEEIEASTRASGSQILFAKLILAGGADLVFLTLMIFCQAAARQRGEELLGLVLYTGGPVFDGQHRNPPLPSQEKRPGGRGGALPGYFPFLEYAGTLDTPGVSGLGNRRLAHGFCAVLRVFWPGAL